MSGHGEKGRGEKRYTGVMVTTFDLDSGPSDPRGQAEVNPPRGHISAQQVKDIILVSPLLRTLSLLLCQSFFRCVFIFRV